MVYQYPKSSLFFVCSFQEQDNMPQQQSRCRTGLSHYYRVVVVTPSSADLVSSDVMSLP